MAGPKQIPEPWRSFLGELDQQATEETRLDCMGGFVVTHSDAGSGLPLRQPVCDSGSGVAAS